MVINNQCATCPENTTYILSRKTCVRCPNDTIYDAKLHKCYCPNNTTLGADGTCNKCKLPLYYDLSTKQCKSCEAGLHYNLTLNQCYVCPKGFVLDQLTYSCVA
jgi:hypothetical protein